MKRAILLLCLLIFVFLGKTDETKIPDILDKPIDDAKIILSLGEKDYEGRFSKDEKGEILSLSSSLLPLPLNFKKYQNGIIFSSGDFKIFSSSHTSPFFFICDALLNLRKGTFLKEGNRLNLYFNPYRAVLNLKEKQIEEISFPNGSIKFFYQNKAAFHNM